MAKLTKPDLKRCQAERSNGFNPFSLGGELKYIRCENVPRVIAKEKRKGKDGKRGSMSLCLKCLQVFKNKKPNSATFTIIKASDKLIQDFVTRLVKMKDEAGRLGLYETMHELEHPVKKVGYEIEGMILAEKKWNES